MRSERGRSTIRESPLRTSRNKKSGEDGHNPPRLTAAACRPPSLTLIFFVYPQIRSMKLFLQKIFRQRKKIWRKIEGSRLPHGSLDPSYKKPPQ
jgi:hypothetical protein